MHIVYTVSHLITTCLETNRAQIALQAALKKSFSSVLNVLSTDHVHHSWLFRLWEFMMVLNLY